MPKSDMESPRCTQQFFRLLTRSTKTNGLFSQVQVVQNGDGDHRTNDFVILVRENVVATLYVTRLTKATENGVAVRAGCICRKRSATRALIPTHLVLSDIDVPAIQSPDST